MSDIRTGINPTQVDTDQKFPLGLIVEDPRGGDFTGNMLKYVFFGASLVPGEAVILNNAASQATRHASVIPSTAINQPIEGLVIGTPLNTQSGWIQISGRFNAADTAGGLTVGGLLGSTVVSGQLGTHSLAAPAQANLDPLFTGRQIRALSAGPNADVMIQR